MEPIDKGLTRENAKRKRAQRRLEREIEERKYLEDMRSKYPEFDNLDKRSQIRLMQGFPLKKPTFLTGTATAAAGFVSEELVSPPITKTLVTETKMMQHDTSKTSGLTTVTALNRTVCHVNNGSMAKRITCTKETFLPPMKLSTDSLISMVKQAKETKNTFENPIVIDDEQAKETKNMFENPIVIDDD